MYLQCCGESRKKESVPPSTHEILERAFPRGNLPPLTAVEVGTGWFPYRESILCTALVHLEQEKE